MKIGDTVRFLKEVGGGRVSGFQDKNTVLVEDSDGFEIPMPVSEVVVERGESYENGTWAKRKEEQKAKTPNTACYAFGKSHGGQTGISHQTARTPRG